MPDIARTPPFPQMPHDKSHSDVIGAGGTAHPLEYGVGVFVLAIGIASFILGMFVLTEPSVAPPVPLVALITAVVSIAVGLFAQMLSNTRLQRILLVTGMTLAFVGGALGLAHGAIG